MSNEISLSRAIGKGYNRFWNSKKRYVVCKGSRGSKKSKTAALWHIAKVMQYPLSNVLVVRKVERTLRDSCFSDLRWAINKLGVSDYWKATTSPLELTYIPTGQKIIFRGLDDPLKITSISVPVGFICFVCFVDVCFMCNFICTHCTFISTDTNANCDFQIFNIFKSSNRSN